MTSFAPAVVPKKLAQEPALGVVIFYHQNVHKSAIA